MSAIRKHIHFWLLVPALIVMMTWPAFYHVLEGETFWIPSGGNDVWYELWEGWYGGLILRGRAELFYTDLLFYPDGVSLIYHQHTVPHMLLYQLLRLALPISSAYSLAFLLTLLANGLAAYICANLFVKDKWISLYAGAFIAICITLRAKTDAQFWTFYTLPLAVYFLHRAICERSRLFAIACAIAVGTTVYIGFYVLVCLVLTVGVYGLHLARSRWRDRGFWSLAIIMAAVCFAISLPRLAPMAANREVVETVLEFRSYWDEASNDLFDFITHPMFTGYNNQQAYLGFVNILLLCVGLARFDCRRNLLHWLLILFVFVVLRLGTFLTIYGSEYPQILLPKHYLNHLFPELFRGFAGGHHWVLGALLPLAILACFGLKTLLRSTSAPRKAALVLVLIALTAIEHYHRPIRSRTVTDESVAFVDWLKTEEEDQAIHLIHVPMNTTFLRRYYNFLQMLTGYPQVEGSVNRLLPEAYAYINSNLLLSRWREGESIHCLPANKTDYESALDRLLDDGFTHVIVHDASMRRPESYSFASVPSAYADDYVIIYRVADLRHSCANSAIHEQTTVPSLIDLALTAEVVPDPDATVLSAHPTRRIDEEQFAYFKSVLSQWGDFAHVYGADGKLEVQSSRDKYKDLNAVVASTQMIVRLQDPAHADTEALKPLEELLGNNYRSCGRVIETSRSIAEYFIASGFPCEIVALDAEYSVMYENGLKLENVLIESRERDLNLYLYWKNRPVEDETYAYSIQVVDAAGDKARQEDLVIGHSPLFHHRLDKSALSGGDYWVNMIVYDFHTGDTVAGTVIGGQGSPDRQIALTHFTIG